MTEARPRRRGRLVRCSLVAAAAVLGVLGAVVAYSSWTTENDITAHRETVADLAGRAGPVVVDADAIDELPAPVQRWVEFTFPGGLDDLPEVTSTTMEGEFRQPQQTTFSPTTAEQVSAARTPSFLFAARVTMFPGLWARAYDAFGDGEMEMKAKVESTITVVDESETPELNATSMQRWLLESPMYPAALLPGGVVRWEAIDETSARVLVSDGDLEASLVATFRVDGSLQQLDAEQDGDLTTSYHGSGEHTVRDDYREVDGIMLPHSFTIARAAGGETFPYWSGVVTSVEHTSP